MIELPPTSHNINSCLRLHVLDPRQRLVFEIETEKVVELVVHQGSVPVILLELPGIQVSLLWHRGQLLNPLQQFAKVVFHLEECNDFEAPVVVLVHTPIKKR